MTQHASLSGRDIHKIVTLAHRCAEADGIEPFNEQTTLAFHKPATPGRTHFLVREADSVIAYAQAAVEDGDAGAELAVDPEHRRRGIGTTLLREVLDTVDGTGSLQVWAHGDLPAATALAASEGFSRDRVLFKLGRRLDGFTWPSSWPDGASPNWPVGDGPPLSLPEGTRLRPFEVGRDEGEWLRVNAVAFADHPEQGRWSADDLRDREAESWFDPDGLIVADDGDGLLGFHWTKVEGGTGEVYVLGVDPRAQGTGVGRVLSLAGLAHLAAHGLDQIELYADESNERAVALYRSQGFGLLRSDVQWSKPLD